MDSKYVSAHWNNIFQVVFMKITESSMLSIYAHFSMLWKFVISPLSIDTVPHDFQKVINQHLNLYLLIMQWYQNDVETSNLNKLR